MTPVSNGRPAEIKLICGLGNPPEVAPEDSLHNLGFMAADRHALSELSVPAWERIDDAMVCRLPGDVLLAKPLFVDINKSGVPVRKLADRFGVEPKEILIIHDDIDIEAGRIKLKAGKSSDRHNGVKSVRDALDNDDFVRLKGGVGKPRDKSIPLIEWVKGSMHPELHDSIGKLVEKLDRVIKAIRERGVEGGRKEISGLQ